MGKTWSDLLDQGVSYAEARLRHEHIAAIFSDYTLKSENDFDQLYWIDYLLDR